MSDTNPSSDRIDQLARSSRWAALIGAGGLLVFVLSLGFGSYYLSQFSDKVEAYQDSVKVLRGSIDSLDGIIANKWERIDELRRKEDSLQALIAGAEEAVQATEQRPTAWIQVANKEQRKDARKMGNLLKQEGFGGFRVPGIETVERLPKNRQIRVFNAEDVGLAETVRDSLYTNGFEFTVQDLSDRYDVEPGILEFWFSSPG